MTANDQRSNEAHAVANPAWVDAAIDDAARRTASRREQVTVESLASVTWPDGALGCPEPGRLYTQSLVPGYRLVLRVGEQRLLYHAGNRGTFTFCPAERATLPAATGTVDDT